MLINKVQQVRQSGKQPNILVIGDIMVDHYIWGNATRLSPEAPVPVVSVSNETTTPGGAANVAQNLITLGARVTLCGVVGNDVQGRQLSDILRTENVDTCSIITDATRPTTVKTRVLAGSHQLVRVDREVTAPLNADIEAQLIEQLNGCIASSDIVLFSDYNKGLFSTSFTQKLVQLIAAQGKKIIVDPKGLNYGKYKGSYIIKPNRKELIEAAKTDSIKTAAELLQAAHVILEQTQAHYLVVTLSEEGMAIVSAQDVKLLPVKATGVFDVTGAGDTVLAAMAYFIAAGFAVDEACEVANHAAAIVIRQVGSATTTIDEIIEDMVKHQSIN